MSTAISFLSGKGGSGKTTLALGVADLLWRCEVKTLLVDCDLSTNGATYFYESLLTTQDEIGQPALLSFNGLISGDNNNEEWAPIKIGEGLDFIPSILNISDHQQKEDHPSNNYAQNLHNFIKWAKENYEAILFDCQAGYVEFFQVLLPLMDVDLFVMEADSISAAAVRSLHLKIGNFLGRAHIYQVFNKATPEEFDIYSKIVGTFFTNIGTLLFDWKIRQAFSRSQIPDIGCVSAQYSFDLCNICKIILPRSDTKRKIESVSIQLRYRHLMEEREQTVEKLEEFADAGTPFWKELLKGIGALVGMLASLASILLLLINIDSFDMNYVVLGALSVLGLATIFMGMTFLSLTERNNSPNEDRQKYEHNLRKIDKELENISQLQRQLKSE